MASTYSHLCQPFFDSIAVGDPEGCIRQIYEDFCKSNLKPIYVSSPYDVMKVPVPRVDLLANKQVIPLSLEVTRGCPFSCEFCALTGVGTRHHVRPSELVVRDIREGQRMLRGLVPRYKQRLAFFTDNNIGGNLSHLKQLCEALTPLDIRWGSAATFNVVANLDIVKILSQSGCRTMFVGLESFNRDTIIAMHKYQNAIDKTRIVMDQCRDHGILIIAGLMISPTVDDCNYIRSIPSHLKQSGLHIPSFICFECPIPGTPHFQRLAAEETPAFLPNALLRDFTGYTLVTRPKLESLDNFIETYKWLMNIAYSKKAKIRKFSDDLPRFLSRGYGHAAIVDLVNHGLYSWNPHPDRTYVAGTDVPPLESTSVPLTDDDFESEEERDAIMKPWQVTDSYGQVLPEWVSATTIFGPKGQLSPSAKLLFTA